MKKYRIDISNENLSVEAYPGDHIVKAIGRLYSRHKSNGCGNGGCGVCKIKIIGGKFSVKKWSKAQVSDEEFKEGYILGCRVFPESDMVIEYLGYQK